MQSSLVHFFLIAVSVADAAAAVNTNGSKTLLANGVNTFFIKGKLTGINGLKKLRNPSSQILTFVVGFFNTIHIFFKDPINFVISFTSLFISVIPGP